MKAVLISVLVDGLIQRFSDSDIDNLAKSIHCGYKIEWLVKLRKWVMNPIDNPMPH